MLFRDSSRHPHDRVNASVNLLADKMDAQDKIQERIKEKFGSVDPQARIGGKGSARRKKKVLHRSAATDDKKLQSSLKKLGVNTIPGIEEVNFIKDDGQVSGDTTS